MESLSSDAPSDTEALLASSEDVSDQLQLQQDVCVREAATPALKSSNVRTWARSCVEALRGWVKDEIVQQVKLAVPIVLTLFFEFSLLTVSLVFIGHQPDKDDTSVDYSAAALATSVINVTGVAVGHGLASAADTLCAQTYGYKNYKRVGVIFQRGVLILGLTMFIVLFLWLNTEPLLLLTRQPPCVAKLSALYVKIFSLSLPFLFLYILLARYLQAQSIMWVFVVVGFLANIISIVLHAILIYGARLGFTGAAIALTVSYCTLPLMVLLYLKVTGVHRLTWGGWSWQSLREWKQFMKLAVPGLLMLCWEWWGAEATTFVAGAISETELAVNTMWFQSLIMFYMVPIGIGISVSIRVGNELGAGEPLKAKRAAYVALAAAMCVAVVYTVILESTRNVIGSVFIKGNDEVVRKVAPLMHVACGFLYSDLIQVTVAGVLRGSGRQYIGAIMNFVAYFVIGLPLGITLAIKLDMGALGLWVGMTVGNITQAIVFIVVLARTNWEKEAQKAMDRGKDAEEKRTGGGIEEEAGSENDSKSLDAVSLSSSEGDPFAVVADDGESGTEMISLVKLKEDDNVTAIIPTEESSSTSTEPTDCRKSHAQPLRCKSKARLALTKGSFLVVGVAVLIAGGILSREYHYPTPVDAYSNCSGDLLQNLSNESFSSGDPPMYDFIVPLPTSVMQRASDELFPHPTPSLRTSIDIVVQTSGVLEHSIFPSNSPAMYT